MADAWNSFRVREFEHLMAGPTVALLRVSGRPLRRRPNTGPRPVLLADDGQVIRRFAAIPAPPDERGVLRAAYSVTTDLVVSDTSFSLELADGTLLALPAPQPGRARPIPEPGDESAPEAAEDPQPPEGIDERRSGLVPKLAELSVRVVSAERARGELERSVVSMKGASERLKHELVGARERAARAEAEARKSAIALEEVETSRPELEGQLTETERRLTETERRLTEATAELSTARAAQSRDEVAAIRLGGGLAEATARAELLQAQVDALGDQLAEVATAPTDARSAPLPYSASEREVIAEQAEELVAVLAKAEGLTELAAELAGARVQADVLYAAASADPPSHAGRLATEDSLIVARAEIDDLRAQLARARDAGTQALIEALHRAAVAEAHQVAEHELELAQAAPADE